VSQIILPDEQGQLPSTFADDSYADDLRISTVTVLAQFPSHVDLTWHSALLVQMRRREVKYNDFRKYRDSLPTQLVRDVLRGLRKAIVVISDDLEFRRRMAGMLENLAGKKVAAMDLSLQSFFANSVAQYADEMVLLHSPLARVEDFVGHGFESDNLQRYRNTLKNPRNVRVFACRTTGAFVEVINPETRRKAIAALEEYRYFSTDRFESVLMRAAGAPRRVFDEGNRKVTDLVRGLRQSVHDRLEAAEFLLLPDGFGGVAEAGSDLEPAVGASDIAAGYARDLYESADGRRKVSDAFDLAFLNGSILR